jgi:5'-methylthioadenosine phosphorylase
MSKIGIIGGTGTYNIKLENESTIEVDTPFGPPSDVITLGEMNGKEIAFLPRHGRYHQLLPHEINYQANIYTLKTLVVETLISICTVGSLKEALEPGMTGPNNRLDKAKIINFFW